MKNILQYNNPRVIYVSGILLVLTLVLISAFGESKIPFITWEELLTNKKAGTLVDVTEKKWDQAYLKPDLILDTDLENFYLNGEDLVKNEANKYNALPKPIIVLSREEDQSRLIADLLLKSGVDSVYFIRGGLVSLKYSGE